jgi:hypothetical protein
MKRIPSSAISRASVIASFPVEAVLGRYVALLRRCNKDDLPAPGIYKRPVSLFNHSLNSTDEYDDAELDDDDRLFRKMETRNALVSRTETCVALHYMFGHHVMFTPALGEVARLLATIVSIEELESTCRRVYFDTHIVDIDEGQIYDDMHVGRTMFWFIPKAADSKSPEEADKDAGERQTTNKRQRTADAVGSEAETAGNGSAEPAL